MDLDSREEVEEQEFLKKLDVTVPEILKRFESFSEFLPDLEAAFNAKVGDLKEEPLLSILDLHASLYSMACDVS